MKWSIHTHDGEEVGVVEARGRRQALIGYQRGVGRGALHHSGSFVPVLLGAHEKPLLADKRRGNGEDDHG